MNHKTILLVEDDETLGYVLTEYLQMKNFKVHWAKDGEKGIEFYSKYPIDICLLDIMMPGKDGFEVAERIREISSEVPIIFLTARSLKVDKLKGFKLGADDYITKPVDEEELIARITAILRRSGMRTMTDETREYSFGDSRFNVNERVLWVSGKKMNVTEKEGLLLYMLLKNKGELLPRETTLKRIWGQNDYFSRKSMDVHIYRLRNKLKNDKNVSINNIHGKGYILSDHQME